MAIAITVDIAGLFIFLAGTRNSNLGKSLTPPGIYTTTVVFGNNAKYGSYIAPLYMHGANLYQISDVSITVIGTSTPLIPTDVIQMQGGWKIRVDNATVAGYPADVLYTLSAK